LLGLLLFFLSIVQLWLVAISFSFSFWHWGTGSCSWRQASYPLSYVPSWLLFSLSFFFFCGTGIWTQVFTLATQVFYCLSHVSSPFCSSYFGNGVLQTICSDWPWTTILPISVFQVVRITGMSNRCRAYCFLYGNFDDMKCVFECPPSVAGSVLGLSDPSSIGFASHSTCSILLPIPVPCGSWVPGKAWTGAFQSLGNPDASTYGEASNQRLVPTPPSMPALPL
jgi:hypothetical protein